MKIYDKWAESCKPWFHGDVTLHRKGNDTLLCNLRVWSRCLEKYVKMLSQIFCGFKLFQFGQLEHKQISQKNNISYCTNTAVVFCQLDVNRASAYVRSFFYQLWGSFIIYHLAHCQIKWMLDISCGSEVSSLTSIQSSEDLGKMRIIMSASGCMCTSVWEMMTNQSYNAIRLFSFTSANSKDKQLIELSAASDWSPPAKTGLPTKDLFLNSHVISDHSHRNLSRV